MSEYVRWVPGDRRTVYARYGRMRPHVARTALLRYGYDTVTGQPCWMCRGRRCYGFDARGWPVRATGYGKTPCEAYEHFLTASARLQRSTRL